MAGRKQTYRVVLEEQERERLERIVASRNSTQGEAQRARVLLACHHYPRWSDEAVAQHLGGSTQWVRKWRKRRHETKSLKEAPRPGRPRAFSPEARAQATALACMPPEQAEVPLARWSCTEIAATLARLGVVAAIATSTVWRWLQAERLKPWAYHLWQHSQDPQFLERARAVLMLYKHAVEWLRTGIWVICVDEKTSIQAREGVDAPRPPLAGQPQQLAARYRRRGALQLFAALSVADGRVYGQCQARKRFVDFQQFFLETGVPEAQRRAVRTVRVILDHGPTHAPKRLERWLHEQQSARSWPFTVEVTWLPKYASWLDQIELWFSILQRKVLTPNHFVDLEALTQRILGFIEHHNRSAKPIQWSYTVEKLEQKFAMN